MTAFLAGSDDPGAELGRLVALGQGAVDTLPGTSFDASTRAALKALLGDLPHPSGTIDVSLTADPGIGPARLAPMFVTGLGGLAANPGPLFDGLRVTVDYSRDIAPF